MCQLGTGMVSIQGQRMSPQAGAFGWVAGNSETRGGDLLVWSSLQVGGRVFSVWAGLSEGGKMEFPSLYRG